MRSIWQEEVERRRRQIAEEEAENLELRRRTSLAESTVTHQLNETDLQQLFVATRDSSLATAHVRFIGKKKPIEQAKYISFRIQNFYHWHLVHQFNNFTQSLLKVEEELLERLSALEGHLEPSPYDYRVTSSENSSDRLKILQRIIDSNSFSKSKSLPQSPQIGDTNHSTISSKDRATLLLHDGSLDDRRSLEKPWLFFEEITRPELVPSHKVASQSLRDVTDLAIEIDKRYGDRRLANVIMEERIYAPCDLLWLVKRVRAKIKVGGKLHLIIDGTLCNLSPSSAIDALTYLGYENAIVQFEDGQFTVVTGIVPDGESHL